ncbi:Segmentation protein paired-like protein, partial [Leptotrombidium deliense]
SSVEDGPKEAGEPTQERRKAKMRHKFTDHDLEILNGSFEQNPYPDYIMKEELASKIHCQVSVIHMIQETQQIF